MNWTIIGCGWLGTRLAESLIENGDQVIGTTTQPDRLMELERKGIISLQFSLNSQISNDIIDFTQVLVISVPPFNRDIIHDYGNALVNLVNQFHPQTKFFFLSSTGVYPSKSGLYHEDYCFEETEQQTALYQAEKKLMDCLENRLTILRLGGLFGADRHPVYHVAGKQNLKDPDGKINFVGEKDVIGIIKELVKQNKSGGIYNLVYPSHPTRKSYYLQLCKLLNLPCPTFTGSPSCVREISSQKIQNSINFEFRQII